MTRHELLAPLSAPALRALARAAEVSVAPRATRAQLIDALAKTRRHTTEGLHALMADLAWLAGGNAPKAIELDALPPEAREAYTRLRRALGLAEERASESARTTRISARDQQHLATLPEAPPGPISLHLAQLMAAEVIFVLNAEDRYSPQARAALKRWSLDFGVSWRALRQIEPVLRRRQHTEDEVPLPEVRGERRGGPIDAPHFEYLGGSGLHVCIAISGFLSERTPGKQHWEVLLEAADASECYVWRWRANHTAGFLGALAGGPLRMAGYKIAERVLRRGAASATATAARGVALLPLAVLDSTAAAKRSWEKTRATADAAGAALADALHTRALGARPVTLVGFSLGGRIAFRALQRLARLGDAGVVENAFILGGAMTASSREWRTVRRVVANRLVNVYSRRDRILSLLYRVAEWERRAAGNVPAEVPGVEDVDLSATVTYHLAYRDQIAAVLEEVRLDD